MSLHAPLPFVLAALLLSAGTGFAQTRAVTLSHGLRSSPQTWLDTKVALSAQRPDLTFLDPPTNPSDSYGVQANTYRTSTISLWGSGLGTPRPVVAVGHSNGGVMLREAVRQQLIRPQAVVTVGSPNRGAQAITSGVNLFLLSLSVGAAAWDPLLYYTTGDTHCPLWCLALVNVGTAVLAQEDIYRTQATDWIAGASFTLANEMEPQSSFLSTLNSSSNRQAEAAWVPSRVAIVSQATFEEHPAAQLFSNGGPAVLAPIIEDAEALYLVAFSFFANLYLPSNENDPDPARDERLNAYRWVFGASALHNWAAQHCQLLGATAAPWGPGWNCPSDGIVPTASQEWDGASQTLRAASGVGHLKQTQSTEIRGFLSSIIAANFQ